jgi:hypothetical protein
MFRSKETPQKPCWEPVFGTKPLKKRPKSERSPLYIVELAKTHRLGTSLTIVSFAILKLKAKNPVKNPEKRPNFADPYLRNPVSCDLQNRPVPQFNMSSLKPDRHLASASYGLARHKITSFFCDREP